MNPELDIATIIKWREADLGWKDIGVLLSVHPERARSFWRNNKDKHVTEKTIFSQGINITEGLQRIAFPTDEHIPFHDPIAIALALQIISDFNPSIRVTGSDKMDFYSISKYDKNPERMREAGLQDEIDMWHVIEREWISAAPDARSIFINGNHEDRLRRYLWKHPEIADLRALRFHNVLELDSMGIEYAGSEIIVHDKLVIKHGKRVSRHSGYSAKAELEDEKHSISVMTGHVHRGGSHYVTTRRGIVQAHECFCLCRLDPEYVKDPNWQQGIALATVSEDYLSVELIPFFDEKGHKIAYWRDKRYVE
jgi:hypothetical protein